MKKLQILAFSLAVFLVNTNTFAEFNDIDKSHTSADAIEYLQEQKIVKGYANNTFNPEKEINRADFTKIIISASFPLETIDSCIETYAKNNESFVFFSDVSKNYWGAKYICTAKMNNVIQGYADGKFHPEWTIPFSDASKIIIRSFGYSLDENEKNGTWYTVYIKKMADLSAIPLEIKSFDSPLTRVQMAEMIYRLRAGKNDRPSQTYEKFILGSTPNPPTLPPKGVPKKPDTTKDYAPDTECPNLKKVLAEIRRADGTWKKKWIWECEEENGEKKEEANENSKEEKKEESTNKNSEKEKKQDDSINNSDDWTNEEEWKWGDEDCPKKRKVFETIETEGGFEEKWEWECIDDDSEGNENNNGENTDLNSSDGGDDIFTTDGKPLDKGPDWSKKYITEHRGGEMTVRIPFEEPYGQTSIVRMEKGEAKYIENSGDVYFSGMLNAKEILNFLGMPEDIPVYPLHELKVSGRINDDNPSRNKITLKGEVGIRLEEISPGGLVDLEAIKSKGAAITIDSSGVVIIGELERGLSAQSFAGFAMEKGAMIEAFFSGNPENWYVQLLAEAKKGFQVLGFEFKKKGATGLVRITPEGIKVEGMLSKSIFEVLMRGLIDQFGPDIEGQFEIDAPLSLASNVVDVVTDGLICGYEVVTDAAICGYEKAVDGVVCGYETVTNGTVCGYNTVTSATLCGTKYITSGAECGYNTITNGAVCGYKSVGCWLNPFKWGSCKEPKECRRARSCDIAVSCKVATSCSVPKSCDDVTKPKTCENLQKPKTCRENGLGDYIGDARGTMNIGISAEGNLKGSFEGEYCFNGDCHSFREDANYFEVGPPAKICFDAFPAVALTKVAGGINEPLCVSL